MPVGMSAVGGRADVVCQGLSGPFIAKRRHADAISTAWILPSFLVSLLIEGAIAWNADWQPFLPRGKMA